MILVNKGIRVFTDQITYLLISHIYCNIYNNIDDCVGRYIANEMFIFEKYIEYKCIFFEKYTEYLV